MPTSSSNSNLAKTNGTNGKEASRVSSVLHNTSVPPPVAVSAHGIYFDLDDGRRIMDGFSSAAVACIGNTHPVVVEAIKEQASKLSYTYHWQLSNEPAELLAQDILDRSKGAFAFCGFVCGGTEAMEAAIRTARQYWFGLGETKRTNFIGRKISFHGMSLATLSLGNNGFRSAPFYDMLDNQHFHHVSPPYARRFQKADESEEQFVKRLQDELEAKFIELGPETVAAFVVETVIGGSCGVIAPPKGYFPAMKAVCDKYGALLVFDEIMCGMGRVGTFHAWESFADGVTPDIQAIAKGLGGGYTPIGALLISEKVDNGLRSHPSGFWSAHTYQAHPLSCAASLAVQKVIKEENLLANNLKQGAHLGRLLHERLLGSNALAAPYVFDIRGRGCWWAIEFDFTSQKAKDSVNIKPTQFGPMVAQRCFKHGLIIVGLCAGANLEGTLGDHCMFAPAYNVSASEIEAMVDIFVKSVDELITENAIN